MDFQIIDNTSLFCSPLESPFDDFNEGIFSEDEERSILNDTGVSRSDLDCLNNNDTLVLTQHKEPEVPQKPTTMISTVTKTNPFILKDDDEFKWRKELPDTFLVSPVEEKTPEPDTKDLNRVEDDENNCNLDITDLLVDGQNCDDLVRIIGPITEEDSKFFSDLVEGFDDSTAEENLYRQFFPNDTKEEPVSSDLNSFNEISCNINQSAVTDSQSTIKKLLKDESFQGSFATQKSTEILSKADDRMSYCFSEHNYCSQSKFVNSNECLVPGKPSVDDISKDHVAKPPQISSTPSTSSKLKVPHIILNPCLPTGAASSASSIGEPTKRLKKSQIILKPCSPIGVTPPSSSPLPTQSIPPGEPITMHLTPATKGRKTVQQSKIKAIKCVMMLKDDPNYEVSASTRSSAKKSQMPKTKKKCTKAVPESASMIQPSTSGNVCKVIKIPAMPSKSSVVCEQKSSPPINVVKPHARSLVKASKTVPAPATVSGPSLPADNCNEFDRRQAAVKPTPVAHKRSPVSASKLATVPAIVSRPNLQADKCDECVQLQAAVKPTPVAQRRSPVNGSKPAAAPATVSRPNLPADKRNESGQPQAAVKLTAMGQTRSSVDASNAAAVPATVSQPSLPADKCNKSGQPQAAVKLTAMGQTRSSVDASNAAAVPATVSQPSLPADKCSESDRSQATVKPTPMDQTRSSVDAPNAAAVQPILPVDKRNESGQPQAAVELTPAVRFDPPTPLASPTREDLKDHDESNNEDSRQPETQNSNIDSTVFDSMQPPVQEAAAAPKSAKKKISVQEYLQKRPPRTKSEQDSEWCDSTANLVMPTSVPNVHEILKSIVKCHPPPPPPPPPEDNTWQKEPSPTHKTPAVAANKPLKSILKSKGTASRHAPYDPKYERRLAVSEHSATLKTHKGNPKYRQPTTESKSSPETPKPAAQYKITEVAHPQKPSSAGSNSLLLNEQCAKPQPEAQPPTESKPSPETSESAAQHKTTVVAHPKKPSSAGPNCLSPNEPCAKPQPEAQPPTESKLSPEASESAAQCQTTKVTRPEKPSFSKSNSSSPNSDSSGVSSFNNSSGSPCTPSDDKTNDTNKAVKTEEKPKMPFAVDTKLLRKREKTPKSYRRRRDEDKYNQSDSKPRKRKYSDSCYEDESDSSEYSDRKHTRKRRSSNSSSESSGKSYHHRSYKTESPTSGYNWNYSQQQRVPESYYYPNFSEMPNMYYQAPPPPPPGTWPQGYPYLPVYPPVVPYYYNEFPVNSCDVEIDRRALFVGNIENSTTEDDLIKRFEKFGRIRGVKLHFRHHQSNYGFVYFAEKRYVERAIKYGNEDGVLPQYKLGVGIRNKRGSDRRAFAYQNPMIPFPVMNYSTPCYPEVPHNMQLEQSITDQRQNTPNETS